MSASASADSIRGFISMKSMQVFLIPLPQEPKQTHAERLSISTSFQIRTTLLGLKTGDYVVLAGRFSDSDGDGKHDEVIVEAIESVGLSDLIGTWRSSKWQVVRFEDYNRMTLYRPQFRRAKLGTGHMNLAKFKDLSYSLAPEQGDSYSIFLVEKQPASGSRGAVYVGRIQLRKSALTLEIFDPKTGRTAEVLTLSPIRD